MTRQIGKKWYFTELLKRTVHNYKRPCVGVFDSVFDCSVVCMDGFSIIKDMASLLEESSQRQNVVHVTVSR